MANPIMNVTQNMLVGKMKRKGSSMNMSIYMVNVIATTMPMTVPIKPEARMSAAASYI